MPMILQWDESWTLAPTRSPGVNDEDYKPPFPLTAKLNKLTDQVDRPKLTPEDIRKFREGGRGSARRQRPLRHGRPGRISPSEYSNSEVSE